YGLRQPAIQLLIPLNVRAKSHRDTGCRNFEDSPERVFRLASPVDQRDHLGLQDSIDTSERRILRDSGYLGPAWVQGFGGKASDHGRMAGYLDAEFRQKQARHRAGGDASGSLASAGPFENVAQIVSIIFDPACKVRVTGPRAGQPACTLFVRELALTRVHDIFPVFMISILDHERDRRP